MRTWKWGQGATQQALWVATTLGLRSYYGPWGDTLLDDAANWYDNNEANMAAGRYASNNQHAYCLNKIDMQQIKAKLGQIPILIQANLQVTAIRYAGTYTVNINIFRLLVDWDLYDTSARYRDISAGLTWANDAYFPWWGEDIEEDPFAQTVWTSDTNNEIPNHANLKPVIEKALRDNSDCKFYIEGIAPGEAHITWNWRDTSSNRPYIDFTYIYPIEFYAPLANGDIDLLNPMDDEQGNEYFIGAVERGETGQAVKGWLRNYSGALAQIDLWDDFPEVTTPFQSVGTGTGLLDYAEAIEPATSQKYTAIFYSATQFEVVAEAYRENPLSYHPGVNGDVTWRGDIFTDFNSPEGNMRIPAIAWQRGVALADEFVFNVKGNTTDSDWPADGNEQVEITFDNAGNPDNTNWRPITARRAKSRLTVTIDAAEKFIPIDYCDPSHWPIGNKAFIMNAISIDEGIVKDAQVASMGAVAFSGVGLDDMTIDSPSNYNGNLRTTYRIRIDGNGTPDTFEWSRSDGATWNQSLIDITGAPQEIEAGIWIEFAATTGHTIGDYWTIDVEPFGVTLEGLSVTSNGYGAGSLVATSLPFRDVESAVYSTVSEESGISQTPASRLYLEEVSNFTAGEDILIQKSGSDPIGIGPGYETKTIAVGGVNIAGGFLELTSNMTYDYQVGDFVSRMTGGERAFWMRPVATLITVEELKKFRLNAKFL